MSLECDKCGKELATVQARYVDDHLLCLTCAKAQEVNAIKILEQWLTNNGYDGLYDDIAECGCVIGDLCPCGDYFGCCKPGYKHPCDDEYDFYIRAEKPEVEGE